MIEALPVVLALLLGLGAGTYFATIVRGIFEANRAPRVKRYAETATARELRDLADGLAGESPPHRILVAGHLRALAEELDAAPAPSKCTGLTAAWCPVHGDCRCERLRDLEDPRCPLHAPGSDHGEGPPR